MLKRTRTTFSTALLFLVLLITYVATKTYLCNNRNNSFMEIEKRAEAALTYSKSKGMNQNYCLLLDYSIPSGQPRLFVWSFEQSKVIYQAHAMHGPGRESTAEKPVFSNQIGSNCSSLGKFLVTQEHGRINKTGFRLKGLESSNSNAYYRGILIHRSRWVDAYKLRKFIPLNKRACQGCVTVSTTEMKYLHELLSKEKKVLLWSFCNQEQSPA